MSQLKPQSLTAKMWGEISGKRSNDIGFNAIYRTNQIPGLLMLIDFEKAVDTISWKCTYSTLDFLILEFRSKKLYPNFS